MEIIKYPDGQINVKVETEDITTRLVKQRINSYEDLFKIASLKEVLDIKHRSREAYSLEIPCLFGQRSDRRFSNNESFGLKQITDFINRMNFQKVSIFDPHSDVSLALINNSEKISSFEYVKQVVEDLGTENLVLVSPDAGAYKKVFKYAEDLDLPLVAANKFRDLQGKVSLNILGDVKDKTCLIIDDICDGGYTFYLLSKALKEQGATVVNLYISHGYFSKGFNTPLELTDPESSLDKCINRIYCTNSVKDLPEEVLSSFITQYKII